MKNEPITLKNTKAEILEALNEALEREKKSKDIKSNPEKEQKEKVIKETIEKTRVNVEQKIFSEELNKKFNDLETAISAEEEKLKNLYGIEKELNDLVVVVNAGKDCIAEIEDKKHTRTEELNNEIQELEDEYKRKNDELKAEYDLKAKNLKTERDREIEEYNYKTKRERELSNNKWEDDKMKREASLSLMEENAKKLLEEAEQKIEYMKELEDKVNEIPNLMKSEYEKGKKEIMQELEKEHKYSIELLKKDYKNTIDRQQDKIELLQGEIEKSNNLNALLQEKLDKAYIEVKELATRTVEATGGVKILSNGQND